MIENLDRELQERLAAAVAKTVAKQEAKRQERAWFKARRDAGLKARHAGKLAHNVRPEGGRP